MPTSTREVLIIMHLGNVMRVKPLQKARRIRELKLLIAGLDANKKAICRCMAEAMRVENGMMRLWQPVEGQHPEDRRKRSTENGQLKRDGNEGRPAIERAPGDVHGITIDVRPVLEAEAAKPADEAAEERNQRHHIAPHAHGFGKTFHGKRSVGFVVTV